MDYAYQLCNTATWKLDSIHGEGIRMHTGAFRTLNAEALHVEAIDSPLELRRNKLGQRFLYILNSNILYINTLNTLDQNYKENEMLIKPSGFIHRRFRNSEWQREWKQY